MNKKVTFSDFQKDINNYLDRVSEQRDTLIITGRKNKSVVIMSLNEYDSFLSTFHELSSKTNVKKLDTAIEKIERHKSKK